MFPKMTTLILIIVGSILSVARFSSTASAPFITKCKAADSECITANAVKAIPLFAAGIPELGTETLDPSFFGLVDASKTNLKFLLKNITLTGLKDSKALSIIREPSKSKMFIKLECAVEVRGQYLLSGNVLAINIEGEGPIYVKINFIIDLDVDVVEVTGKDDKKHFNIKKFTYTYDILGNSVLEFGNLFPNNEVLRAATAEVIQNSPNEIVRDIGDPMFRASATKNIKNINSFFKAIPIEDLALD